jgi:hypothetical protein
MGKPRTLLEELCGHALSFGADSISVERKDGVDWVFAQNDGKNTRIFQATSARDAEELRQNLTAAAKKPVRTVIAGNVFLLTVRIHESSGEESFDVAIDLAPAPDPSASRRSRQSKASTWRLSVIIPRSTGRLPRKRTFNVIFEFLRLRFTT